MIDGYEKFTYIGYTFRDAKPTFYFKEGRYTQVHKHKENEGWHPVKKNHRATNINGADAERYSEMRKKKDYAGIQKFGQAFLNKDYDSEEKTSRYFECSTKDEKKLITHLSRSRLIRVGDPDFHMGFDEKHAKDVLKTGKIAENENVAVH